MRVRTVPSIKILTSRVTNTLARNKRTTVRMRRYRQILPEKMVGCAVVGCTNNQSTPNIHLYSIPKDSRRSEYIRRLGRADRIKPSWKICSAHFTDDAYERNALHQYVYVRGSTCCKQLNATALPTEHLPSVIKVTPKKETPRSSRCRKRVLPTEREATREAADTTIAIHESLNTSPPAWIKCERDREHLTALVTQQQKQIADLKQQNANLRARLIRTRRSVIWRTRRIRHAIALQHRYRRPYGFYPNYQLDLLRRFESLIATARFGYREDLLPFQEGLLISVKSTIQLLTWLQGQYPYVHTIFASKLDQDVVENTFSRVRGLGGFYDRPSPTEVDYRLRIIAILDLNSPLGGKAVSSLIEYCRSRPVPAAGQQVRPCTKCDVPSANVASASTVEIAVEPLRYVAGYVAFKLRKTNPELGDRTSVLRPLTNPPTWIDLLSKGGLIAPSDAFFRLFVALERRFLDYFGSEGLHTCNNIVQKVVAVMRETPGCVDVPLRAITLFARLRVFIRIRHTGRGFAVARQAKTNARKLRKFVT
jgi:hypothetical protein